MSEVNHMTSDFQFSIHRMVSELNYFSLPEAQRCRKLNSNNLYSDQRNPRDATNNQLSSKESIAQAKSFRVVTQNQRSGANLGFKSSTQIKTAPHPMKRADLVIFS